MAHTDAANTNNTNRTGLEVAVIGMAGRFPGAANINEFWENLTNGSETIAFFSQQELEEAGIDRDTLQNPNYIKANGYLQEHDCFDAAFFGYTPIEAEIMDPQLRLFHECSWHALEDAGYCPDTYNGLIGIYAGATANFEWEAVVQLSGKALDMGTFAAKQLTGKDYLNLRVSYKLNLKIIVPKHCCTIVFKNRHFNFGIQFACYFSC